MKAQKKIINDTFYLYRSIPKNKITRLQKAIHRGLATARQGVGVWEGVRVNILLMPKVRKAKIQPLSNGRTTKKGIHIAISKKYLNAKNMPSGLSSSIIHEYVHFKKTL